MRFTEVMHSSAPRATILIRLLVGLVFVSEGAQKFLEPGSVGAGRFARMGIASSELVAGAVGVVEIACGLLVVVGLLTRLAAIPLVLVMLGALVTTKLPILLGRHVGPFQLRELDRYGFLSMAHEARIDWAMLLGSLFLVIVGAGAWSLDRWLTRGGAHPVV